MKDAPRVRLVLAGVVAACLALAVPSAVSAAGDTPQPPKVCCFINERFTGVCRVMLGKGETCGSIEAYLNNPSSSGRTYCDTTNIRGGWIQVDCKTGKPKNEHPPTPPAARSSERPQGTRPAAR